MISQSRKAELPTIPSPDEFDLADKKRRSRRKALILGVASALVLGSGVVLYFRWAANPPEISLEASLERALAFHEGGNHQGEIQELKSALSRHPDHELARRRLGEAYLEVGDGSAALIELQRARRSGFQSSQPDLAMLRAQLLQGNYSLIIGQLATEGGVAQGSMSAALLGEAWYGLEKWDNARAAFSGILVNEPENERALLGLARVALRQQKLVEAGERLGALLAAHPRHFDGWMMKGELALAQGRFAVAQEAFSSAKKLSPQHIEPQLGLGIASLGRGDDALAGAHLSAAQKLAPKHPLVKYYRAVLAIRNGDTAAVQLLREVLLLAPGHQQSLLLLGALLYNERHFEQAQALLQQLLVQAPEHAIARKILGMVHLELSNPGRAVEVLSPALEAMPEDAPLLALLGYAYLRMDRLDEALKLLTRAVARAPEVPEFRMRLAMGHLAAGSSSDALVQLGSALEIEGGEALAGVPLVLLLLREGRLDEAIARAESIRGVRESDALVENLLGVARLAKGETLVARGHLVQAAALDPGFVAPRFNLVRVEIDAGNVPAARELLRQILEISPENAVALTTLASLAQGEADAGAAVALLERARRANPEAIAPRMLLVEQRLSENAPVAALDVAQEAARLRPRDPGVLLALGRAQLAVGEVALAQHSFSTLTNLQPSAAQAWYHLGVSKGLAGDSAGATKAFEETLKLAPAYELAHAALGTQALQAGDGARALEIARTMKQVRPDSTLARVLSADALMQQGRYLDAASEYGAAISQAPHRQLLRKRYLALDRAGRQSEAFDFLREWVERDRDDVGLRRLLAFGLHREGQAVEALTHYEQILQREPQSADVLNNMATIYDGLGDQRALMMAARAYRLMPAHVEIADTYGWLLVRGGDTEQGLSILRTAARNAAGGAPELRFHLAAALAGSGARREARRELEALLAGEPAFSSRRDAEALLDELTARPSSR